jgi:hypothetical protein
VGRRIAIRVRRRAVMDIRTGAIAAIEDIAAIDWID